MANPVDNIIFLRITQLVLDEVWPDNWTSTQKVELIDNVVKYHESVHEFEICAELEKYKHDIKEKK